MSLPGPAEVQRFTEEVLQRPEFRAAAAPRPQGASWIPRLAAWLAPLARPLVLGLSAIELIALGAAAALSAVLVLTVVRAVRPRLRPRSARPWSRLPAPLPAGSALPASPADALRAADASLAGGDARGAVQALLHACLLFLAGRGLVALAPGKTVTAYVRECPAGEDAAGTFREVAAAHNDLVYAHRLVDPARVAELGEALRRRVGPS